MFPTYLARNMNDSTKSNHSINNESREQDHLCHDDNGAKSSAAVSTIPQILVALNLAFSLTKRKDKIHKTNESSATEEVATDASVKHCKTNGQRSMDDTIPATIITTTTATTISSNSRAFPGEITFDSYDSDDDEKEEPSKMRNGSTSQSTERRVQSTPNNIQKKIQSLRQDLRDLQPKGVAGNTLFWWIHPVKWVSDPGEMAYIAHASI